ncbi:hypothetical protein KGF56_001003 [Candida oxycetoniae]|uniref:Protein kinase domain-containing protein n=1 Tax=Candida oxycetoniae TaxID=497107 RepID=A0AAI9WZ88_9ASCO|nr:uncharacterized protein KGF56_001003 [Candida oxycetoniae]KAI3406161.2 hypothetical protein KGF56_001003 [Candida oxycetoniae]
MTSLHSNSEYILAKKSLGQGSYSIVYECKSRSNGRHCAAKKYRKKLVYGMESLLQSELEILKSVSKSHKHILSLIDYFETKDCFYLLTDLAQGGDLYDRIVNGSTCGRLNDSKARNIVSQLVSAVAFLHSNNIVHRDIKTENIFFQAIGEDDDSILLGDFGLAKVLKPGERLHDISGTLSYMAPEMFDRKAGYSYPIDVWAIGVCLYFMLGGYLPFDCETDEETKDAIMGKKYLMEPSEYWTGVSENAKAFILDCFRDEENGERPSSSELKNKPFLIEGNVILPSPVEGNTTATATATYRTISTQDCQQIKNILLANDSTLKPREELELSELYPDFDETAQLPVFLVHNDEEEVTETRRASGRDFAAAAAAPPPIAERNLKTPTFKKIQLKLPNPNIKFNKQLLEYGYQEPLKTYNKVIQNTYIRPFQLPSFTRKDSNSQELVKQFLDKKKNLVEYDMDEQDVLFLKARNDQSKNVIKITFEIFEIMISTLESEWSKLEHQMNSVCNFNNDNGSSFGGDYGGGSGGNLSRKLLTVGHNNARYGNDDGIEPGSIYDQKCAVCNDSDCDNSNAIVFCDGCDIAVHQECYGVAFIPEGQWLCRKCMINKNKKTTECVFCPSTTGAFKQLDNSLWSHVICALWINELYFANPVYMEPIEGIDAIPKSRWKLTCYICKQRVGACIQCTNRNCFQAYHVTCAKRAGLYMEMTHGIKGALLNKLSMKSFCEKHSPASFDVDSVLKGIDKTRCYFRDIKLLNQENARLSSNEKFANKLNIFKWKTEQGAPIAPKLFSDILVKTMYNLKVENQISLPEETTSQVLELSRLPNRTKAEIDEDLRSIANEVCRYWCLKRELKNGAPLVRKNNNLISTSSILYDSNNLESNGNNYDQGSVIEEKLQFANLLVDDLDKLIAINQDVMERQKEFKEMESLNLEIVNTAYFSLNTMISLLLNTLAAKHDTNETLKNYIPKNSECKSLFQIMEYNDRYGYKTVDEFQKDATNLWQCVFTENKPSFNIYKKMKNWKRDFEKNITKLSVSSHDDLLRFHQFNLNGTDTTIREVDYQQVLQENDLSEIEDEMNTEENNRLFEAFLNRNEINEDGL